MPQQIEVDVTGGPKRLLGFQLTPDWHEIKIYYLIWKMRNTQADPRPLARPTPVSFQLICDKLFELGFRRVNGRSFDITEVQRMYKRVARVPAIKRCVEVMTQYVAQHPTDNLFDLDVEPLYKMYDGREVLGTKPAEK